MTDAHRYLGLAVAGLFLLLFLWGLVAWVRNRHPGQAFWTVLAIAQVGLLLPALSGGVLFATGGRQHFLHYVYGVFPVLVLAVAHRVARRLDGVEWAAFAVAGLFSFGLLLRGFMTGVGG